MHKSVYIYIYFIISNFLDIQSRDWNCLANNQGSYTLNSFYNFLSNSFIIPSSAPRRGGLFDNSWESYAQKKWLSSLGNCSFVVFLYYRGMYSRYSKCSLFHQKGKRRKGYFWLGMHIFD